MNKSPLFLIFGLSGAGLLSGLAARRMTRGAAVVKSAPALEETKAPGGAKASESAQAKPTVELPPSTDTVETLLALDDAALYPRLAVWLAGSGEPDIAEYWNGIRAAGKPKAHIVDLLFLQWTRLNPEGAIAAVAGTKDDHFPWWAWTASDPDAALIAAIAKAPRMVERVAGGIGRFHPDWLLENLNRIPEAARPAALRLFKEQNGGGDPLESLKLMRENGLGNDPGTFKKLVQEDPWEALDWLGRNPSMLVRYEFQKGSLEILMETMVSEHPDDLERIAAQLPSGLLKRNMEAAAFDQLLADDPETAIARAEAAESPLIARQRFVKIGISLAETDPDRAFSILEYLREAPPLGNAGEFMVETPEGSSSWMSESTGTSDLQDALIRKDPGRFMDVTLESGWDISTAASGWASQDIVSYAKWVDQQRDPAIREPAVSTLIDRLEGMGQFSEAVDWARTSGKAESSKLGGIFRDWARADANDAAGWLEASDLSVEQKARFRGVIQTERTR